MEKDYEFFASCTCGNEAVRVVAFDIEKNGLPREFWVSIMAPQNCRRPFLKRLKYAFDALRGKAPYGDNVGLSVEDARRLQKFIELNVTPF
jgi:hypothetical protein